MTTYLSGFDASNTPYHVFSDGTKVPLWQDKQLLLFPVLSGISCMVVTLLLVAGSALAPHVAG